MDIVINCVKFEWILLRLNYNPILYQFRSHLQQIFMCYSDYNNTFLNVYCLTIPHSFITKKTSFSLWISFLLFLVAFIWFLFVLLLFLQLNWHLIYLLRLSGTLYRTPDHVVITHNVPVESVFCFSFVNCSETPQTVWIRSKWENNQNILKFFFDIFYNLFYSFRHMGVWECVI